MRCARWEEARGNGCGSEMRCAMKVENHHAGPRRRRRPPLWGAGDLRDSVPKGFPLVGAIPVSPAAPRQKLGRPSGVSRESLRGIAGRRRLWHDSGTWLPLGDRLVLQTCLLPTGLPAPAPKEPMSPDLFKLLTMILRDVHRSSHA